jgi:hypothetical protein
VDATLVVSGGAVEFHVVKAKVDAKKVVGIRQLGTPRAATDTPATRQLTREPVEVRKKRTARAERKLETSPERC